MAAVRDHLRSHHAYAPDLRGHGDATPPLSGDFAWTGFADDVLAIVDALGFEDLDAVGHSKGGAALLLAEARRPGTFRSLYLYEPVVMPAQWAADTVGSNPLAEGALRRRPVFARTPPTGTAPATASVLDPTALLTSTGFQDQPDGTVRLSAGRARVRGVPHDPTTRRVERLHEVKCPVTVAPRGSPASVRRGSAPSPRRFRRRLEASRPRHFRTPEDPRRSPGSRRALRRSALSREIVVGSLRRHMRGEVRSWGWSCHRRCSVEVSSFTDCASRRSRPSPAAGSPSAPQREGHVGYAAPERLFCLPSAERTPARRFTALDEAFEALLSTRTTPTSNSATRLGISRQMPSSSLQAPRIEDPQAINQSGPSWLSAIDSLRLRGIIDRLEIDEQGQFIITDYRPIASPTRDQNAASPGGPLTHSDRADPRAAPMRMQLLYLSSP